jgi:hypothetical protein
MKRQFYLFYFLFVSLGFSVTLNAQHVKYHKPISEIDAGNLFSYHASLGAVSYSGDLAGFGDNMWRPSFSGGISYRFNPRFSVNPTVSYYRFYANDIHERRNLDFYSNNYELSARIQGDIFPFKVHYHERKKINPYGFLGIGLLYFNPKTEYNGGTYNLRKQRTEGVPYSPVTFVIPMGLGVRYTLHHGFEVALEGFLTKAFSDYLDDVSQEKFVDVKTDKEISSPLHDRSSGSDFYKSKDAKRGIQIKVIYIPSIHKASQHMRDL